MTKEIEFKENSEAVQAHLGIMQSVIQRMASDSSSSKAWCITLVSAILVVVADKGKPQFVWIALIPTLLFFVLDAYYLALEKGFRNSYNSFIEKLHEKGLRASDLYVVVPEGSLLKLTLMSAFSFSVWPFYITLLAMIYVARVFVL
jgi:hypothetical protein